MRPKPGTNIFDYEASETVSDKYNGSCILAGKSGQLQVIR